MHIQWSLLWSVYCDYLEDEQFQVFWNISCHCKLYYVMGFAEEKAALKQKLKKTREL